MKNEMLLELRGKTPRSVIAKELGITPQGLGMIERGERIPRPGLMKDIAVYYGKTVDDLFFNHKRHEMCLKDKLITQNETSSTVSPINLSA